MRTTNWTTAQRERERERQESEVIEAQKRKKKKKQMKKRREGTPKYVTVKIRRLNAQEQKSKT